MASYNRAIIMGNLTKDVDHRVVGSGTSVASITIATNERYKDKNGEWVDKPEFHSVTLWGRTADVARDYLAKSSPCMVEGRIQTEKYQKDGVDKWVTKIVADKLVLLGGKGEGGNKGQGGGGQQTSQGMDTNYGYPDGFDPDQDIPF